MRGALTACALGALVLAGGTAGGGRKPAYATLSKGTTSELVRVDPATLRISGPRLPLWRHDLPWVRSPEGSRLAIGSGRARSIRVVDLRGWYVVRDLRLPSRLVALAWPREDLLVVVVAGRCCPESLRALALDSATGHTRLSAQLGTGPVVAAARTPDGLALLLASQSRIEAPRLVTLDSAARVRSVRVDGVEAGWTPVGSTSAGPPLSRYRTPGLAVDPAGRRALVAGGAALAAVDLRTFRVRASPLRVRRLADGGFSSGTYRRALWLRGDTVAVTGWNHRVTGEGARRAQQTLPAGLLLVDARRLAVRRLDSRTSNVTRAGRLLIGLSDAGATAYTLAGTRRYRTLRGVGLGELPAAGGYAYSGAADSYRRHLVLVFDLRDGRRVRDAWVPGAMTLLTDATPRVCWC